MILGQKEVSNSVETVSEVFQSFMSERLRITIEEYRQYDLNLSKPYKPSIELRLTLKRNTNAWSCEINL